MKPFWSGLVRTNREYDHQQVIEALARPPRQVQWKSRITAQEVRVGRERERQLIAEAERHAANRKHL